MAETAVALPIIGFLVAVVILAFFGVWRAEAANWGVFASGVSGGAYNTTDVRETVPWPDIRNALSVSSSPTERQVRSRVSVKIDRPFMFGLRIREQQSGEAVFRRWDFYPGRPEGFWR